MILGVGVDVVDLARFDRQLRKTPALLRRLFTAQERELSIRSLAARFAAKEALVKALGGSGSLGWHDLEIIADTQGAPSFAPRPSLVEALEARKAAEPLLSMSHDGGIATAFVVLQRRVDG